MTFSYFFTLLLFISTMYLNGISHMPFLLFTPSCMTRAWLFILPATGTDVHLMNALRQAEGSKPVGFWWNFLFLSPCLNRLPEVKVQFVISLGFPVVFKRNTHCMLWYGLSGSSSTLISHVSGCQS